jgi:hypothetical protein
MVTGIQVLRFFVNPWHGCRHSGKVDNELRHCWEHCVTLFCVIRTTLQELERNPRFVLAIFQAPALKP